jgi:xanthine dehydrogenase YagR molybdenum-binding subunit
LRKANAPVKLMLTASKAHEQDRPDSHQMLKIGAKSDGTLTAIN